MDEYNIIILVLGLALLGIAYLPTLLKDQPLSYPVFYIALGIILFKLPLNLPNPDPILNKGFTTHVTELVVIISLMGTGLKIDKKISLKTWKIPIRLVTITMIVSIFLFTMLGVQLTGLTLASAVLLAASLAPTDPVLASDIQVGPPREEKENEVKFALTSEAGLNDSMAFPFVHLAIVLVSIVSHPFEDLSMWFLKDLVYRMISAAIIGWSIGKLMGIIIFKLPKSKKLYQPSEGFVGIAITLLVYGVTEIVQGYGFLAVFITAVVFRNAERDHEYHSVLHNYVEQFEKLLIMILLILFGGSISYGLLSELDLNGVLYGIIAIFIIRPLVAYFSLIKTNTSPLEKFTISFFGIRGIGCFFYLAYGLFHQTFTSAEKLWSILGFTVLLSVLIHGMTASFAMKAIEKESD